MANRLRVAWLEVDSENLYETGELVRTVLSSLRGVKAVQISDMDPDPPPLLETEAKIISFLQGLETSAGPTRIAREGLGWRKSNSQLVKQLREMAARGVIYSDNGRDFEAVIEEDA